VWHWLYGSMYVYVCIGRECGVDVPILPSLLSYCIFFERGRGCLQQNEDLDFEGRDVALQRHPCAPSLRHIPAPHSCATSLRHIPAPHPCATSLPLPYPHIHPSAPSDAASISSRPEGRVRACVRVCVRLT
jgi:hypothetical protein